MPSNAASKKKWLESEGMTEELLLWKYSRKKLPETELGSNATSFYLYPGSVLFFPRGIWHTTRVEEESFALAFSLSPTTWIDQTVKAIRHRLIMEEDWRQFVISAPRFSWQKQDTRKHVRKILRRLPSIIKSISAKDLLPNSKKI